MRESKFVDSGVPLGSNKAVSGDFSLRCCGVEGCRFVAPSSGRRCLLESLVRQVALWWLEVEFPAEGGMPLQRDYADSKRVPSGPDAAPES